MTLPVVVYVSTAHEFAGAERYLQVLLESLRDRVQARALLPPEAERTAEALTAAGAQVHLVPGLARSPRPGVIAELRRRLAGADLIHLNLSDQGDGLAGLAAAALRRKPVVASLHNVVPGRASGREHLAGLALRVCDLLLLPSEAVAGHARTYGRPVRTVPNGLPVSPPHPAPRSALGLPPDVLVVGGIGRLHEQKAWHLLAAAAPAVRAAVPGVRLVVIGGGHLADDLAASGLELLGPRPDGAEVVGAFDVLALPSRYESFGYVALEAMQAGVPVVAAAVGGLPEVVGDAGVLVPAGDPQALATALIRLLNDPAQRGRLAERGRARARGFNPQSTADLTFAAYRSLLAR